ncbi:conserved hypothetical protein [Xenorhabdus nematophila F1]|uniref:Uncharacterized protein n=1 Tax=Xenorhabdus nematophila (strain ATCC 19061 / DSM 3370 / CCUG 14189 / LMG 1036 / NCIMB 9965 / AN6) TaxID=406817 RepID=D3VFD4_XENNA|nr:conserved hypothetical protein [Xenorhabdus nematophila ATCC 19061]CCW32249.1 conserved hypothetical protein [Xenorhabdus nematophila F1]
MGRKECNKWKKTGKRGLKGSNRRLDVYLKRKSGCDSIPIYP